MALWIFVIATEICHLLVIKIRWTLPLHGINLSSLSSMTFYYLVPY